MFFFSESTRLAKQAVLRLLSSPSLVAAAIYGVTGLGFAGANLIFARALAPAEYGLLALLIGLVNLLIPISVCGIDGVVNRQKLEPSGSLLGRTLLVVVLLGSVGSGIAALIYSLDLWIAVLLGVAVLFGGATHVAAAEYQSAQRFLIAQVFHQCANALLLAASLLVLWKPGYGMVITLAILIGGYLLFGAVGWGQLFRARPLHEGEKSGLFSWGEAVSYAGISGAGVFLVQLERLVTPKLLSLEDLATFGVLAAAVIAPFRTLQLGVGFTLLPRMRSAKSIRERRSIFGEEFFLVLAMVGAGSVAIYFLGPWIIEVFVGSKYVVPAALVIAAIVAGALRTLGGFAKALTAALCSAPELALLNGLMWASVALAALGAWFGSAWGLVGLIYGVTLGWVGRVVVCVWLVRPYFSKAGSTDVTGA